MFLKEVFIFFLKNIIFFFPSVFQIWKCFKNIFLEGRSLETRTRSGDEERVSAAFIKTNGFQPDDFWFRMSMKKNFLSIMAYGREDIVGATFQSTGGVRRETLHGSAQALPWPKRPRNILLVDRNGGTCLNHLQHSPYFFFFLSDP